ncbi:MAG: hypothetical protein JST92_14020, partial [Deltaproteobacteria bacterium]|nr:hypothetical protein [Deltaproteobacteria bacterium]
MMRPIVVALCACVALSSPALAGPLPKDKVPDPLKSWTAWALHGHEGLQCPTLLGNDVADDDIGTEAAGCKFVTRLELSLDAKSGRFSESARSFVDGFVPLPGGDEHWPNDVKVDGKGGAVIARDGAPVLWLTAGDHVITGTFAWTELPESISVPPETGLVSLTLRGKSVPFPVLEDSGLLWLQREGEDEAAEENRVELTVFRQIVDDVPTRVITRLKLEISGKNREVLLGRALLDGFVPLSLDSPLPARLEPDGRLRVQVRPGTFRVSIEARHDGPLQKLALEAQPEGQQWAPEEIWVYSAVPSLRLAEVQGLPQIDAAQTRLDDDWKRLPAYRVRPGESLTFAEQRRGDADPAPDKVDLTRTIWLDFDGKGATSIDALSGTLSRSWRLEMQAPQQLGRAMIGGEDQLITRTSEAAAPGVEVRSGRFAMSAESRLDGSVSALPAVGWDHDVNSLSVNLNMPPGWRLVHAGGVDEVSQTWLQRWSLLDLFVVLMVALAAGKLFGVRFGILAFVTLGLSLPEGAPRWAWLAPLVAEALLRVVPAGIAAKLLNIARVATWTVLAILLVPFSVTHLRSGLTPSVENRVDEGEESASIEYYRSNSLVSRALAPPPPENEAGVPDISGMDAAPAQTFLAPNAMMKKKVAHKAAPNAAARDEGVLGQALGAALGGVVSGSGQIGSLGRGSGSAKLGSQQVYAQNAQRQMQNIDPQAIVQTGTGMPNWTWRQITLHWSGPVEKSAKLVLWLLPPWANLVLSFLRVLLLAALFAVVILRRREGPPEEGPSSPGAPGSSTFAATAAVIVLLLPAGARADADVHGMPSDDLLTQLRQKLTERPACMPDCAQSPKLVVDASGGQLKLKFEIAAAAQLAVPLPGSAAQWTPERVLLDGAPAKALLRSGDSLYVLVPEGLHTAELSGPIPPRDSVQLALPLRPHRVEAHLEGFTLDGLHPDGTTEESLQLTRKQRGTPQGKLEPGQLPAFAEVRRALVLGLTWEVQTEVVRRSPAATPATLEVPLLPGES